MASIKKVLKGIVEARTEKQVFYIIHISLFHVYINCPNILWEWIPQLFMLHVGE